MASANSQIQNFFKDQTIFLTGATGFLGKVIIEKLLRNCQDFKKIYVLLRPKKGKTMELRFQEMLQQPCFELLECDDVMEKVALVGGDCGQPSLGISQEDLKVLKEEVTCVIHLAANVKFDQSLKESVHIVTATRDILKLSMQMENLKCFVFVSTAYSNCVHSHVKEEIYSPPIDPTLLLNMVKNLNEDILERITPALLDKWPNTYVYSKCISEHLVAQAARHFPVTVVRPSIIMNSAEEPLRGWIDNIYGPTSLVVGGGLGIIRAGIRVKRKCLTNIIPVDYVCNCVLAATWKTAKEKKSAPLVYNYVGLHRNPLNWSMFHTIFDGMYWKFPLKDLIWYDTLKVRENELWLKICTFLLHTLPAHVIDAVLCCLRKPPIAVKTYAKIDKHLKLLSYFCTRDWSFEEGNVRDLWREMSEEDKKLFNFSMAKLRWEEYFYGCVMGIRRFMTKDPPAASPRTFAKMGVVMVMHYLIVFAFWYLMYEVFVGLLSLLW